jgi:hypothetical protein
LVTLFTSEQARSLDAEGSRSGGGRRSGYMRIAGIAVGLALVTIAALVSMFPLTSDVVRTCCSPTWDPSLSLFALVSALLVPLAVWQVSIAVQAIKAA